MGKKIIGKENRDDFPFADNNLPFTDIFVRGPFSGYTVFIRKTYRKQEVTGMRHIYFRGFIALLWLAAAAVALMGGSLETGILYIALALVFAGSAYSAWKKEKGRGDR